MGFTTIALLLLGLINPRQSAELAAVALRAPSIAPALSKICWRESRCNPISVHSIDVRLSDGAYRAAIGVGWLDAACQPPKIGAYSTRGAFGLMAAFNVRHVDECMPPEYLDVPLISALTAGMKLIEHCSKRKSKRHPATSRWAFRDRVCRFVPRNHARSAAYILARAHVRELIYSLMPNDPTRPVEPEPLDVRGDEGKRRDAGAFPITERPEKRSDGTVTTPARRQG